MSWYLWIILFFGPVLGVIIWLMTSPLILTIDSSKHLFCLQWGKLIVVQLLKTGLIQLSIPGWTTIINPWKQGKRKGRWSKPVIKKNATAKKQLSLQIIARKFSCVLRTFQVHRFELNLDTEDFLLNAYLYPLFRLLSKSNHRLQINFAGENSLHIIIENRLYRIATAFIRS